MEANLDQFVAIFNFYTAFFDSLLCEASRLYPRGNPPKKPVMMIHSSMSALGTVPLGASTMLAALKRAAESHRATIVMPSHSDRDRESGHVLFDRRRTPCARMGALAEAFRKDAGTVRSAHPLLSFTARGPRARSLMSGHSPRTGLGPKSPAGKLLREDALILLLGVGYESCTILHLAEYEPSGNRDETDRVTCAAGVCGPFARVSSRAWTDIPLDSSPFGSIGRAFEDAFPERIIRGDAPAPWRLMRARELVAFSIDRTAANGVP